MNKYFDRVAYGRKLIEELSSSYSTDDIYLMASYLLYEGHMNGAEAAKFINKAIAQTTRRDRKKEIKSQIERAYEQKAFDVPELNFYKEELEAIGTLKDNKRQRVLFTMLAIAKYCNYLNPKNDDWVSKQQNFIFSSAGVHDSIVEQCQVIYDLKEAGLIANSKKTDSNRVKILFCRHDSARPVFTCRDLMGLGAIYQNYIGGIYMRGKVLKRCAACDTPFLDSSTHNNRFYCIKCRKLYPYKYNICDVTSA